MPRQVCLDVPGALHHIMVRGINKSAIFKDDQGGNRLCSKEELGLSGAEIARHLGVNTSSIDRAIARVERGEDK